MDLEAACQDIVGLHDYFLHVRELAFEATPDYELLRSLLGEEEEMKVPTEET